MATKSFIEMWKELSPEEREMARHQLAKDFPKQFCPVCGCETWHIEGMCENAERHPELNG